MDRVLPRRDFLDGMARGAAGLLATPAWLHAGEARALDPEKAPGYYPPALTGLRGSHEGSYETAHALKDGGFWSTAGAPSETGESYDLVVVGAGISGLAAAHFFRARSGGDSRILLLDNHDDFGGHAKRNELRHGRRVFVGYGGSFAIDSPAPYSAVAKGLVEALGIDVSRDAAVLDRRLYPALGLGPAFFFDRERFGADCLLPDPLRDAGGESGGEGNPELWDRFLAGAPIAEEARRDLRRLALDAVDYMAGLASDAKKARLARMSYADFLTGVAGAHADVVKVLQARPHSLYGVGIEAVSALDAWGLEMPGFLGLGLDPEPAPGMGLDAVPNDAAGSYFFHFPDGNAAVARLLVRALVPRAVPGRTSDDVVTARVDYSRLDEPDAPVRLRLNSTVVRVRHRGDPAVARELDVDYVKGGRFHRVRAKACVLACWNGVIPHLCPELPEGQKEALAYGVKVPIVYTNVLVRSWTSFVKLGASTVHAPGGYHTTVSLDLPVSLGDYRCPRSPDEPIVLHLMRTPCSPGLPTRAQHRAGRLELLSTPFETFEREIRSQLARILGPGGFDPARDVEAITVNRWPHGYAYQYNSLWDPFWLEGGELPCVAGRRPFGRVAIANADAAAYSYLDAAVDQAHRAVGEILRLETGKV